MADHDDTAAHAVGQVDGTLEAVLAHWGVTPVSAPARATSGVMNETYLVTTVDRQVVLRRHRRTERRLVDLEHRIIGYARECGVPAPPALPTPGGSLVVEDGGRLYSLFAHAPGRQLSGDELHPGHARSMGATLAFLHEALADFPVAGARPPKGEVPTPQGTLRRIGDYIAQLETWPDPTEHERWALDDLRGRAALLEGSDDVTLGLLEPPAGTNQLLHGDFQESNLFFSGEQVVAVIDWDKASVGWPPAETVRTLDLALGLGSALCTAFLEGYRSVRDLTTDDLDTAAHNYGFGQLHGLWLYDMVYLRHDDRCRRFIRPGGFLPFADRWARLRAHRA